MRPILTFVALPWSLAVVATAPADDRDVAVPPILKSAFCSQSH